MGSVSAVHAVDERLAEILARAEDAGGELSDEDAAAIESLELEKRDLCDQIARSIVNIEMRADGFEASAGPFDAEAKRLRSVARVERARADWLKAFLAAQIEAMGHKSLRTSVGTATVRTSPQPKIEWKGGEEIPAGFRKQKVEWAIDRDAVLEAEQHGVLPEGFSVTRKRFVAFSAAKERKEGNGAE